MVTTYIPVGQRRYYQEQPHADVQMRDTGNRRTQKHWLGASHREIGTKHTNGFALWLANNSAYDGGRSNFRC